MLPPCGGNASWLIKKTAVRTREGKWLVGRQGATLGDIRPLRMASNVVATVLLDAHFSILPRGVPERRQIG